MAPTKEDTGDTIIHTIQLLQCIIFLVLYILSYYQIRQKLEDGITLYIKLIMSLSFLFITAYTIRYLLVCVMDYTKIAQNDIVDGIKDLLFAIGHSCFYLIMISRLYFVFRSSPYALSKRDIMMFVAAWMLILVCNAIYFIVAASEDTSKLNISLFFFVLVLLDIILGGALIIVFTRRLFSMAIASARKTTHKDTEEVDEKSASDEMYKDPETNQDNEAQSGRVRQESNTNELSQTQMILVSAAAKYALLCGTTILFINLQFFARAVTILSDNCGFGCEIVLSIWFVLALFMELFTIYLSFPNTSKQYAKICGGCHKIFEGTFRVKMMDEIERKQAEELNQLRHVCCFTMRR